ncbi:hypothetical protein M9Y10_036062 [Tritrichomonas musculus]|uniref:Ribonuclease n=1 Tax=Tritrichomonas musculus TaxID=1915356 RepID=A0ABR2GVY2_9EUKA
MKWSGAEISFPDELKDVPLEMGIDEAGRGPILGPMVYSCAFAQVGYEWPCEVDDSKALTPEKRKEILEDMKKLPIGFSTRILSAVEISAKMLATDPINLNEMSHDAARMLIQSAVDANLNVQKVFVDTVGPPEKYQDKLQNFFPKIKIKVSKKADSLFKSVGAASINAKVTRDEILENFQFEEKGIDFPRDYGSGYPNGQTKIWLEDNFDPVFCFPSITRFSWDSSKKIIEKKKAEADFETVKKPPVDSSYFSRRYLRSALLD